MSGGSLDYIYWKVEEAARSIRNRADDSRCDVSKLLAFADHLDKVAKALHDVEWTFSGDYDVDGFEKSVSAVVDKYPILEHTVKRAEKIMEDLHDKIQEARKA